MSFRLSLWPKLVRFVDNFKIISLLIIIFKTHFKITFNPFAHIRSSFQLIFYMRRNNYRIILNKMFRKHVCREMDQFRRTGKKSDEF